MRHKDLSPEELEKYQPGRPVTEKGYTATSNKPAGTNPAFSESKAVEFQIVPRPAIRSANTPARTGHTMPKQVGGITLYTAEEAKQLGLALSEEEQARNRAIFDQFNAEHDARAATAPTRVRRTISTPNCAKSWNRATAATTWAGHAMATTGATWTATSATPGPGGWYDPWWRDDFD
ncbi:hypothetical protein [Nocardia sp. NPDC024068]|uniref:hypothetical protein n=1 Tax=Nocardia sp. NPDC024068 TaxID=3157197 RepID=UPI0033D0F5DC